MTMRVLPLTSSSLCAFFLPDPLSARTLLFFFLSFHSSFSYLQLLERLLFSLLYRLFPFPFRLFRRGQSWITSGLRSSTMVSPRFSFFFFFCWSGRLLTFAFFPSAKYPRKPSHPHFLSFCSEHAALFPLGFSKLPLDVGDVCSVPNPFSSLHLPSTTLLPLCKILFGSFVSSLSYFIPIRFVFFPLDRLVFLQLLPAQSFTSLLLNRKNKEFSQLLSIFFPLPGPPLYFLKQVMDPFLVLFSS